MRLTDNYAAQPFHTSELFRLGHKRLNNDASLLVCCFILATALTITIDAVAHPSQGDLALIVVVALVSTYIWFRAFYALLRPATKADRDAMRVGSNVRITMACAVPLTIAVIIAPSAFLSALFLFWLGPRWAADGALRVAGAFAILFVSVVLLLAATLPVKIGVRGITELRSAFDRLVVAVVTRQLAWVRARLYGLTSTGRLTR